VPNWFYDQGSGVINVTDASFTFSMEPYNDAGSLRLKTLNTKLDVGTYSVSLQSQSEIGRASQLVLNSFETVFRS